MNTDFTKDHFMINRKGPKKYIYEVPYGFNKHKIYQSSVMSNRKGPIRNTLTVPLGFNEHTFYQRSVYKE